MPWKKTRAKKNRDSGPPDVAQWIEAMKRDKGIQALDALRDWFRGKRTPEPDHIKALAAMGLVDESGLTPAGRKMLIRVLALEGLPSVRVFSPQEDGTYHESTAAEFLGEPAAPPAPALQELRAFENTVRQGMNNFMKSEPCPFCSGARILITSKGPQICSHCSGT